MAEDIKSNSMSFEEDEGIIKKISSTIQELISKPDVRNTIASVERMDPYLIVSRDAQALFLRLYLRKRSWLRSSQVSYREVLDTVGAIGELVGCKYLYQLQHDTSPHTLPDLLNLLSLPELKSLCKVFNVKLGNKSQMVLNVEKLCRNQKTLFGGRGGIRVRVERKCVELLGDMIRVSDAVAEVLDKILVLSFPQYLFTYEEDSITSISGRGHLSRILLSQFGLSKAYPTYKVRYGRPIFRTALELDNFLVACQLEAQCWEELDRKNWKRVIDLYDANIDKFKDMIAAAEKVQVGDDEVHLEAFTEVYVTGRTMRQCIGVLRRLKRYTESVDLIRLLLRYKPMGHRHGEWWDVLSMTLSHHLKDEAGAVAALHQGLDDPRTTHGARYALDYRLAKLRPDSHFPTYTFEPHVVDIEVVAIEGSGSAANSRNVYIGHDGGETYLCTVEDGALHHYKTKRNFAEGFHCEGGIVSTLFGILFWDVIFADVDNVFYNPYQYCPLDYHSDRFYLRREDLINDRLKFLTETPTPEVDTFLETMWERNCGVGCTGLNWDLFSGVDQVKRCITCITQPKLALLLKEYVMNMRLKRSGLPDLSMWDAETKRFLMVEVKGPGDTIRYNQKSWMKFLVGIGIDAELCNVHPISSKRLTTS